MIELAGQTHLSDILPIPESSDAYASRTGHPPSAAKTVCIDLDKTIIPWGSLEEIRDPFPGATAAIAKLRRAGFRIVIWTSRLSHSWWRAEGVARNVDPWEFGRAQKAQVERLLQAGGIHYDLVTAEKIPALAYFDDKGIRVDESYPLDEAINDFLNGGYGAV